MVQSNSKKCKIIHKYNPIIADCANTYSVYQNRKDNIPETLKIIISNNIHEQKINRKPKRSKKI